MLVWLGHHRKIKPPGLFALYVFGYSAYRIFEESLRIDSSVYFLGLRLNTYIASALAVIGLVWFWRIQRRPEPEPAPDPAPAEASDSARGPSPPLRTLEPPRPARPRRPPKPQPPPSLRVRPDPGLRARPVPGAPRAPGTPRLRIHR